jgi:hypothetical protein
MERRKFTGEFKLEAVKLVTERGSRQRRPHWVCQNDGPCSILGADHKMIRCRSCRPPDTELRVQCASLSALRPSKTAANARIARWLT